MSQTFRAAHKTGTFASLHILQLGKSLFYIWLFRTPTRPENPFLQNYLGRDEMEWGRWREKSCMQSKTTLEP